MGRYRMFVRDDMAYGDSEDFKAKNDAAAVKRAERRVEEINGKEPTTGRKRLWGLDKVSNVKITRKVVVSEELIDIETFSRFHKCCGDRKTA